MDRDQLQLGARRRTTFKNNVGIWRESQILGAESQDLPTGFQIRPMAHFSGLIDVGQMAQFFFHRQQNGKLIEDSTGRWFSDERAACRYAFRQAAAIGRVKRPSDMYVGIEVNDGSRTRCIVRASIVLEKPKWVAR
ncbi:MAG: hypothetical protein U1E61_14655 [Bradyrhizobium sp.]